MRVTVRDAGPGDRDTLVGFIRALNLHEHRYKDDRDTTVEGAAAHLTSMEDTIREKGGFLLIGEVDGARAGYLAGSLEVEDGAFIVPDRRPFGCVLDIYVDEKARGKGLSRAMMDEAMARFRAMGLKRATVTALTANPIANAAYRSLGFGPTYTTYEKRLDE